MAFTELNFVPGEIVTAAKMNLLAANDVWLKENGGGMKFIGRFSGDKSLSEAYGDRGSVAVIEIPEEFRGKKILILCQFGFFQFKYIYRIFMSIYGNNSYIGGQEFRLTDENDYNKKTSLSGYMHVPVEPSNYTSNIEIRFTKSKYLDNSNSFQIRYDCILMAI